MATHEMTRRAFSTLPPGLTRREVQKILGVSGPSLSKYARIAQYRFARQKGPGRKSSSSKYDWDSVNWNEQDAHIARKLGCTRERVRQKRNELGVGKSPKHFHRVGPLREKVEAALLNGSAEMSTRALAEALGTSLVTVSRVRRQLGIAPPRRPLCQRDVYDWRLTNKDLNQIWQLRNIAVERARFGNPAPLYRYSQRDVFHARFRDPKYRRIYASQVEVAKQFRQRNIPGADSRR